MIEFHLDKESSLVIVIMSGDVTYDELMNWLDSFTREHHYDPAYSCIVDMRPANPMFGTEEIRNFIEIIANNEKIKGKWCCLAESPKQTAVAMYYGVKNNEIHPFEIFSSVDDASSYLGIDVEKKLDEF